MLVFNDLLRMKGVDPAEVAVILHTPFEPRLRRLLPLRADSNRPAFEEFQRSHGPRATATLKRRRWMASFVGLGEGRLAFAGFYERLRLLSRAVREIRADPLHRFLVDGCGYVALADADVAPDTTFPHFDFARRDALAEPCGRLVIAPRLTPNYVRRAESLSAPVLEIARESLFAAAPPAWRKWILTGPELRALPPSWAARLREWRGIYLILDSADGLRYVGSAYGAENLLGRWQAHVAGVVGVTKHLKARDPGNFRFSILERVLPDMPAEEVVALEESWMVRLGTRDYGLNA